MRQNTYTHRFKARCPNNGQTINFALEIETEETLMVEDILLACSNLNELHEKIADNLLREFGGKQTLTAHHHGVDIKTVRS